MPKNGFAPLHGSPRRRRPVSARTAAVFTIPIPPAGQGFLCSSRPHPAVCGLPISPATVRNAQGLPLFSPRRGSHSSPRGVRGWRKWRGDERTQLPGCGHPAKETAQVLPSFAARQCITSPIFPAQWSESALPSPVFSPPRKSFIPARCAGMAEVAGG